MTSAQTALEAYLAKNIKASNQTFSIEVNALSAKCTFVPGDSIPYSRRLNGNNIDATVIVPPQTTCIVKLGGNSTSLRIHRKLEGRVIVEGNTLSCKTTYFE